VTDLRAVRRRALVYAALCALAVAVLGGLATEIGPWYRALVKPSWNPPDWLFGPAWTVIYALTALSGVRSWEVATPPQKRWLALLFGINGALNVLWSLLFFRLQRPDWALLEVGLLWLSILSLLVYCGRLRRQTIWLLLPYLAWVSFAATLNAVVVDLNAPFGAGQ
jgi:tryptophan-rich sensory protein